MALPDGATCVVVGDVTGHDVEAAPLMGQIRNMLRALAFDRGGPPGLVVSRLDHALTMFEEPPTATLVFGRIERTGGAGGGTRSAGATRGICRRCWSARTAAPATWHPPVTGSRWGSRRPSPGSATNSPPPGSTLLLFTDGLVERRDQDIDTGLAELAEQAARLATAPLEELCDALISRSRQVFDDDVALLALRIPSDGPAR
ncbi:PP2C family protein-serine/threonine phosphatase [Streptomyces sp. INA 01156]